MRNIKELLQIMLNSQSLFRDGLCFWVNDLHRRQFITYEELWQLRIYIIDHRVKWYSSIDAYKNRDMAFWWKSGDIKPRIKWIKQHIKKLG